MHQGCLCHADQRRLRERVQAGATADTTADAAGAPADDAAHRPTNSHARGEHVCGLRGGGLEMVLGVDSIPSRVEDVRHIILGLLRPERVRRYANEVVLVFFLH